MKIKVEHLGYIHKGEVNLDRNLTVFIGKNQTGKTYLNYTLFSLFENADFKLPNEVLKPYVEKLAEADFCRIDLEELFNETNQSIINISISSQLQSELSWFFALPDDFFNDTSTIIEIDFAINNLRDNFDVARKERRFMHPFMSLTVSKEKNSIIEVKSDRVKDIISEADLIPFLSDYLSSIVLKILFPTPYFALAERSAFNLFHEEFSLLFRGDFRKNKKRKNPISGADIYQSMPYPLIVYLSGVRRRRKTGTGIKSASDYLESNILNGVVEQDERGSFYFKTQFRNGDQTILPLQATASAVKSLAYFDVLIREQLLPGNIVFIDEPEINLHPDNQYHLARVIAMLANAGVKVVVSTHSLTFLQELNNLMMLAQLEDSDVKRSLYLSVKEGGFGYLPEMELKADKVRAYLFNDNHEIESLPVDEVGIVTENIDELLHRLNLATNKIYHQLNEQLFPQEGDEDERE